MHVADEDAPGPFRSRGDGQFGTVETAAAFSSSQPSAGSRNPPTLLHLAGAGPQADLDGRSLVPLLKGDASGWRSDFLIQYKGTYGGGNPNLDTLADVQAEIATTGSLTLVPTYRAVRSNQWLYVEWYDGSVHEYELYDLANDPYELNNRLSTPAGVADNATLTASLQTRLQALASCAGAACRS